MFIILEILGEGLLFICLGIIIYQVYRLRH
jgi:hypothetical protein